MARPCSSIDPVSKALTSRPVTVAAYDAAEALVIQGPVRRRTVGALGVHMLRAGETVRPREQPSADKPASVSLFFKRIS